MEKQVIQSVGFRNICENGTVTGFQFKIRLPYYRGVFLSQLMPGTLFVDGERIEKGSSLCARTLKRLAAMGILEWHGSSTHDPSQYYTLAR